MVKYNKIIFIGVLIIFLVALFFFFYNQKSKVEFKSVECMNYYKFGDNFISYASAEKKSYNSSNNVTFFYTLSNPTNIPLTNAAIRVQIFYNGIGSEKEQGDDMIDEFFAVKDINLNPGDNYSGEFDWTVPTKIKSGKYFANFYLISENKVNMAGLSFVPNIIGAGTKFDVVSNNDNMIFFDRNSTYLNQNQYQFRSFLEDFESNDEIKVTTQLMNDGTKKEVHIIYQVFKFDDLNPSDEIMSYSKTETILLKENSTNPITITLKNLDPNTYLVKFTASTDNQKSILKVRIPVLGVKGRFTFLNFDKFPTDSKNSSIIFCLTNAAGGPGNPSNSIINAKVELLNREGKILLKDVRNIEMDSTVKGFMLTFDPGKKYSYVVLKATLYDDDQRTHDQMNIVYDYSKFVSSEKILNVNMISSSVKYGEDIKYTVSFKTELGDHIDGKIFSYVKDSSGKVVTIIKDTNFNGQIDMKIPEDIPTGKYTLTVVEKTFDMSISKEFIIG
jgi:hypothetical protein